MFSIDPINLIPQAFFTKVVDVTVDVVVQVGRGVLDEGRLRQIRRLRSDGAFWVAFEEGLRRATSRFEAEYGHQDEDLVAAIAGDEAFLRMKRCKRRC